MQLFVRNHKGKKVQLKPAAKTRYELAQMVNGRWFTLDGSDYEYNVDEVFAEPQPDTTIGTWILSFFTFLVILHLFFASFIISSIIYLIAFFFRYIDKKSVKKFNNS